MGQAQRQHDIGGQVRHRAGVEDRHREPFLEISVGLVHRGRTETDDGSAVFLDELDRHPVESRKYPVPLPVHQVPASGRGVAGAICIGEALSQPSSPFLFVDVTSARGIGAYTATDGIDAGVAAADFDGDGDVDIFVPNGAGVADQLYRNRR